MADIRWDGKGRRNGYDYTNQAWIFDGRYSNCGHPRDMNCGCYGRAHAGEVPGKDADLGAKLRLFCRINMVPGSESLDIISVLAPVAQDIGVKRSLMGQLTALQEFVPPEGMTRLEFEHGASFLMGLALGITFGRKQ